MATRNREFEIQAKGFQTVAGVDEVGVGPMAGPVVAAAVILPQVCAIEGIRDSKQIEAQQRADLEKEILKVCIASAVGVVSVQEIDTIGIYQSSALAMRRAVEGLRVRPAYLLVDARSIELDIPQEGPTKGDRDHTCIAAASILAKEFRDRLMVDLDRQYPVYGLAGHKGYPTKQHFEALRKHGISPIHRSSWLAVQEAAGQLPEVYYQLEQELKQVELTGLPAIDRKLKSVRQQLGEECYQRLRNLYRRKANRLNSA